MVNDPLHSRRTMMDAARRFLFDQLDRKDRPDPEPSDDLPRLTLNALEKISMSRSRERILGNLDEMYREAFERAKVTGDQSNMATLDFAYRREQLYFEILLDIRDAMEKRV
jgi:hypothetical protein